MTPAAAIAASKRRTAPGSCSRGRESSTDARITLDP